MGRKKKEVVAVEEGNDILKEFNVRITTDRNKLVCVTYVKAKTKDSALNKIMDDYKGKDYSYFVF